MSALPSQSFIFPHLIGSCLFNSPWLGTNSESYRNYLSSLLTYLWFQEILNIRIRSFRIGIGREESHANIIFIWNRKLLTVNSNMICIPVASHDKEDFHSSFSFWSFDSFAFISFSSLQFNNDQIFLVVTVVRDSLGCFYKEL